MSQETRIFAPEAADEFISFLREEITRIQTDVIEEYFEDGPLARMPAFGIGEGADNLRLDYTRLHAGVWGDIQDLLASYQAFIDALEEIKEANAETEDLNAADFEAQL
ncbi:hypothetical protein [Glycomyces tenuis]|uniref:hypothetical protein n=1 Tax=Glycomyces tenuis TaxID=58116 RepID=UPI0003F6370C|nr:hypothetical protein [Glycomyces tenuis]